jgi:hypothetical protein
MSSAFWRCCPTADRYGELMNSPAWMVPVILVLVVLLVVIALVGLLT